eukprot:gene10089-10157_t
MAVKQVMLIFAPQCSKGLTSPAGGRIDNLSLRAFPTFPHARTVTVGQPGQAFPQGWFWHGARSYLRDIERVTRNRVPVVENPLGPNFAAAPGSVETDAPRKPQQRPQGKRPDQRGDARPGQRPDARKPSNGAGRPQAPKAQGTRHQGR